LKGDLERRRVNTSSDNNAEDSHQGVLLTCASKPRALPVRLVNKVSSWTFQPARKLSGRAGSFDEQKKCTRTQLEFHQAILCSTSGYLLLETLSMQQMVRHDSDEENFYNDGKYATCLHVIHMRRLASRRDRCRLRTSCWTNITEVGNQ
jgi:hypothetical protein